MRFAYTLLSWLLLPVFLGHLLWRSRHQPEYRHRLAERFGRGPARQSRPAIWVHAVSVGEVTAAAPLVRRLLERFPEKSIVVTTTTPTGSQRARDLFGGTVTHCYVPYDAPGPVCRFFDRMQPQLAIVIETEIWPNLYRECGRRGIPLVLASARVSEKSVRRYRVLFGLIRDTLAHGIVIAAQSETDAERFRRIGASRERTWVTGNIKFDFELAPEVAERGRALRSLQAPGRPVWIAASTHQDEEQVLLDAHRRVLERHPQALLTLVPRHPQRFASVAGLIQDAGLRAVSRSSGEICTPQTQVFFGDSMGELTMLYAAADIAFVGGSLVPVGGHNLLEPAALGLPALTGPHNFNAPDIAALLIEQGAVQVVADAAQIATQVTRLFDDPAAREERAAQARAVLLENRGAVDRLLALVAPLLRAPPRQDAAG